MARYTVRENEKFITDNIARYESSASVRNEFRDRGIYVVINNQNSIKTVEKHYHLLEYRTLNNVPMVFGKNFEKTYHIYTDGRINLTATSMNDGSNFYVFFIRRNGFCAKKVA